MWGKKQKYDLRKECSDCGGMGKQIGNCILVCKECKNMWDGRTDVFDGRPQQQ